MRPQRLSTVSLVAYGLPSLPLATLILPAFIFLPTFYAETVGVSLSAVGLVLLLARLWDMLSDPIIGQLSDSVQTRWGRRRPWLVVGTPIVAVAVWFLFVPPDGAGAMHLLVWSFLLYTGWTMVMLPMNAWGAELSVDYHERSRITAFRESFLLCGTILALLIPLALGYTDFKAQAGDALRAVALTVAILLPVGIAVMLSVTPEPPVRLWRSMRWGEGLWALRRNRPFRILIVSYLLNGIANGLPATLFIWFVTHVLREPTLVVPLLLLYFAAGTLSVPLWYRLSRRWGSKHRVWAGAMIWACAVFIWVPLLGPGDVGWFVLVCLATGLAVGADVALPPSIQADVIDEDTIRTGAQRAGLFFALWGMATKLALALAVGLSFPLLDMAGFDQSLEINTPSALLALSALYALAPVIFKLAAIVLMWAFPITAERQAETRRQIDDKADQPG